VGMSGDRSKHFDIIAETRRVRSDEEKRAIVAEASKGYRNASAVARRHGIKPSLLFRWKKQFSVNPVPESTPAPTSFVPIALALPSPISDVAAIAPSGRKQQSIIEIEVAGGRKVRVGVDIDTGALKRIIAALETLL
jgi:transposase